MAEKKPDMRESDDNTTLGANANEDDRQPDRLDSVDDQEEDIVTARDLKAPTTVLASPHVVDVGNLTVELLKTLSPGMSLDEVNTINAQAGVDTRTPVMTVIEAVLAANDGKMKVKSLTEEVTKYWHKPFPTTPYSDDEFVYLIVKDSDRFIIS